MEIKKLEIPLGRGYEVNLTFIKYCPDGDWICQMTDDFMDDLEDILSTEHLYGKTR